MVVTPTGVCRSVLVALLAAVATAAPPGAGAVGPDPADPTGAAAAIPSEIAISATTRWVELPVRYSPPASALSRWGGPGSGRPLPAPLLGFAFSRARDGVVLAGRLRLRLLEDDLGLYASPGLGRPGDVRPGRYFLTVFGPAREVIESLGLPPGSRLGAERPWPAAFVGDVLGGSDAEVHPTFGQNYRTTARTFTSFGLAKQGDLPVAYAAGYTCLLPPDGETCAAQVVGREATGLVSLTGGGGVATDDTQPGEIPSGVHRRLFEAASSSVGARMVGFFLRFETPTPPPTSGDSRRRRIEEWRP